MIINDLPEELDLLKKIVDIEWEQLTEKTTYMEGIDKKAMDISRDDIKNMVVRIFTKYLKIRL